MKITLCATIVLVVVGYQVEGEALAAKRLRIGGVVQRDGAANLQKLFKKLKAAVKRGETKTAAAITRGLFPSKARLRRGLEKGVDSKIVDKIVAMHRRFSRAPDAVMAKMLAGRPQQTEIRVHGAKTADIAANRRGSIVWKEFPGGAVRAAKTILRPGIRYYEVEVVKPGKDSGMKYHLFYWDGRQWSMLGPVWRASRTRYRR